MEISNTDPIKLLIMGSGLAGYTAAIYAARANLKPVLYRGLQPGGQLTITTDVENYPGFPVGIQGPDLMVLFEEQARRMGTDIRYGEVSKADLSERPFKLWIDNEKNAIKTEALIIASGASAKWLGIPSEQQFIGFGVSACAVCDGFFFRGEEVAIVGGGDAAAQEALFLSRLCKSVSMIVRKNEMRASKIMQSRVFSTENITIYWESIVEEILGSMTVESIKIKNVKTEEYKTLAIKGLFVAIGHKPNSDIFKDYIDMDMVGYIKTKPGSSRTNINGVFAVGDVQDKIYRQAVTAAGSGCMGALDAERYLRDEEHRILLERIVTKN